MHPIIDALPGSLCYLDGEYTPLRDARISVLDRGFIFGDGVYEVVPVYGGAPFCFEEHMARLDRSLAELRVSNPLSHVEWLDIAKRLIAASPAAERAGMQGIYIQVTRGVAPREHAMPAGLTPTVFMMLNPLKEMPDAVRTDGVACVSAYDFRWQKAHIKTTSLVGAVLARQISVEAGAAETIMFRGDWLSEASSSNVWVVKDGVVSGPLKDELVLAGIRFNVIERICAEAGIPFTLRRIGREEVFGADELLISSASKEVQPVVTLDGRPIGSGRVGPVYRAIDAGYQRAKARSAQEQGLAPVSVPAARPIDAPIDARKDSLIEYPSQFPIKVMGAKVDGFVHAITQIAERFDPAFDATTVELRPSSGGKYLGVTITVTATSREQLDDIYRALTAHPMVKVVL
ncbi:hypothetical protein GCM10023165_52460 [Variovorax defluvii]|uniref:UPF0250 protein GCM10023165_52460 n=2 Tax=Variovorax defluvii TaxID=913761 RepID=A0ABP8IFR2_9BURK